LTFQFGDGTYTLDNQLMWSSFYGGALNIYGSTSEANAPAIVDNCEDDSSGTMPKYGVQAVRIWVVSAGTVVDGSTSDTSSTDGVIW
jgi:hypothetical protein